MFTIINECLVDVTVCITAPTQTQPNFYKLRPREQLRLPKDNILSGFNVNGHNYVLNRGSSFIPNPSIRIVPFASKGQEMIQLGGIPDTFDGVLNTNENVYFYNKIKSDTL